MDYDPDAAKQESKRLQRLAEDRMYTIKQPVVSTEKISQATSQRTQQTQSFTAVQNTSVFRKSDGVDIVKKNAPKRARYLVMFQGCIKVPDDCRIGNLKKLNTPNPQMEIFLDDTNTPSQVPLASPQTTAGATKKQRLLILNGTLLHPKNMFMTLKSFGKAGSAKRVLRVGDVLETIIVFSEWKVVDRTVDPAQVDKRDEAENDVVVFTSSSMASNVDEFNKLWMRKPQEFADTKEADMDQGDQGDQGDLAEEDEDQGEDESILDDEESPPSKKKRKPAPSPPSSSAKKPKADAKATQKTILDLMAPAIGKKDKTVAKSSTTPKSKAPPKSKSKLRKGKERSDHEDEDDDDNDDDEEDQEEYVIDVDAIENTKVPISRPARQRKRVSYAEKGDGDEEEKEEEEEEE